MDFTLLREEVRGFRLREIHVLIVEIASTINQAELEEIQPVLVLLRAAAAELFQNPNSE